MRFMVQVRADKNTEAGVMPSEKMLADMGKYNDELMKAGVLLAGEGLHPSSKGARVKFSGGKQTVTDGPFSEAKEVVGGYAVLEVNSRDEALEAAQSFMRLHQQHWPGWEGECEIRQVWFIAP